MRIAPALSRFLAVAALGALGAVVACGPQKPPPAADVVVVLDAGDCDAAGLHDDQPPTGTCPFDYGTVPSAAGAEQTFQLENRGNVDATLTAALTQGDPSFSITSADATIPAGGKGTVVVKVVPVSTDTIQEGLVLSWAPPETDIHIDLSATGDGQLPHLAPNPAACAFGNVAVGQTGACDLALVNDGVATLHIESAALADNPGGVYSIQGTAPANVDVAPGDSVAMSIQVKPEITGDVIGHLLVVTNDPNNAQARIDLRVHGT